MPKREQVERMLKEDPQDVFLNYALAMALQSEGKAEEAIAQFRRLLSLDAEHVSGYFQLGQTLAREGRTDEAKDVLATGIQIAGRTGNQHAEGEMIGFLETL